MKGEVGNIIKVASLYVTTILGAGFASGQEIVQFFSSYNRGGFYGVILAGVLFTIIGFTVLDKIYTERIQSYDEFLFPMVGWFIGWIMQIVVTLFMLSIFCIMIAGMGNIFLEKLGIPFIYGIVLMSIVCMVVILTGIKGIVNISAVITPIMVVGIILVGIYIIICRDTTVFNMVGSFRNVTGNWFFSSLLYVSYNTILSVVVMCSLLPYLKTRRTGFIGGILGGLSLCFIALILNFVIHFFYPEVLTSELPVLSIVERYNSVLSLSYTIVLWLAMFTSAITAGFCFIDRVGSKTSLNKKLITVVICALAIPLSSFGFSTLIKAIYPLFGYIGLFMVFVILMQVITLKPFKK